ncbi:bacteriohemerythrin [Stygiobacter electus]|uniref:Bacteriohemerythrin n=1 Tax=Stygiobacter electus TaxID=3032292 RepID=A0AAE3NZS0_9BACT|nr:bacteriohemerythrin [Stygiobacter electus]MDF1611742.1 bacteriohemerythrin [Stygiobacter electus]
MALITWGDSYSVKVKVIDNQHQKLVGIINTLHDAMKEGKGKEAIGKVLKELVDYTVYHFSFEEKLFDKYGYPDAKIHAKQHNDLVQSVKKYVSDFESGKGVLPMEVMNFLRDWLLKHISGDDKKYSPFFNSKGLS